MKFVRISGFFIILLLLLTYYYDERELEYYFDRIYHCIKKKKKMELLRDQVGKTRQKASCLKFVGTTGRGDAQKRDVR